MSNDDNDDIDAEEFLIKQKWRSYKGNLWDAIGAAVDMLIKLTVMVRKASVSVRNSTLAAHFHRPDDYFAGYAKILARNWLKDARRSLTDQLGNSVAVRRRYMLYRMRHEEKINHCRTDFVPAPAKTTLGLLSKREFAPNTPSTPRSTRSANPVFVGTTPSSTNLSQLDRNRLRRPIRNRAAPSGITEGSVSIEETGFSYMFPKPPSLGSMQRYAPCPYCSTPLSAKDLTKDAWRSAISRRCSLSVVDANINLGSTCLKTSSRTYAYQRSVKKRCSSSRVQSNGCDIWRSFTAMTGHGQYT